MAVSIQKDTADPTKPKGEPVKFYLARDQFMDPNKRYTERVNYNGHLYVFEYGKRNEAPREVAEYMRDLGKQPTQVPNIEKYDPDLGGVARRDSEFLKPELKDDHQQGRFQVEFL